MTKWETRRGRRSYRTVLSVRVHVYVFMYVCVCVIVWIDLDIIHFAVKKIIKK